MSTSDNFRSTVGQFLGGTQAMPATTEELEFELEAAIAGKDQVAVYRLIPALAKLPADRLALVRVQLRKEFKSDFRVIDFDRALKEALRPKRDYAVDWRAALITNDKGKPTAILANAVTALREAPDWAGVLAFDQFASSVVARRAPPWCDSAPASWTDQEDRLTTIWLQKQGIYAKLDIAGQAIQTAALDSVFHPVREWLDGLAWDGTKRIDKWLGLYLEVRDSTYASAVGARFLTSCVARIYRPGCKVDTCLILEGPQGKGKSRALRALAQPYFTDEIADLGSKDAALQTRGVWVIEIAELDSMSRSEIGRVKAFMSRETDRFRPPYGKHLIDSPRQCVFAGSVNHDSYLRDETGGRRFWPVRCGHIRLEELARDRDQLWAEAVARYNTGAAWWLESEEENGAAAAEQAERYEGDAWDGRILEWLRSPIERFAPDGRRVAPFSSSAESVTVADILAHCLEKPIGQWAQADQNRVARCLRAMGWTRYRARAGSGLQWRYKITGTKTGDEK